MNTEEIRKALDAATPGPWYVDSETTLLSRVCSEGQERWNHVAQRIENGDAHLIANAPTWLRSLLEENEQQQTDIVTLNRIVGAFEEQHKENLEALQQLREELEQVKKERDEALRQRNGKDYSERKMRDALREVCGEMENIQVELEAKDKDNKQLREFAHSIFIAGFEARELDGSDIQELGTKHSLLIEEPYDPEKHGEHECGPGDPFYTYASIMDATINESKEAEPSET